MQPAQNLALAREIDELCDRFEARWAAGEGPRIEDFVAALPESLRARVFAALLGVELELRNRRGERPSEAEYQSRFPGQQQVVAEVFAGAAQRRAGSGETSVSRESVRTGSFRGKEPATVTAPAETMPARIGRFEVRSILGEGAFGSVYRAHDPQLDRDVAVKVPKVAALGAEFDAERFLREARAVASIQHPNICPVYDAGIEDGRPPSEQTQSGVIMGTPAYMAPEQARGDARAVGPRPDVHALGVMLYEMLAGRRPFAGSAGEVIGQVLHVEPEALSKARPGIDPRLEAVCRKAMAKAPDQRFGSMRELAEALGGLLRESSAPTAATAIMPQARRSTRSSATSRR